MAGNARLLFFLFTARSPPSLAPAEATRPPCASKVARSSLRASRAPCSGAAAGLVTPSASHEGGGTAQRGEGMPSKRDNAGYADSRTTPRHVRMSYSDRAVCSYRRRVRASVKGSVRPVTIPLDSSPSGIRTRDLLHGMACSRRLMMVSRVRLPPILPPKRANMGEHWRTAKHKKPRKIQQWRMVANRGERHSRSSTLPHLHPPGLDKFRTGRSSW
jgi:hypothetical protein